MVVERSSGVEPVTRIPQYLEQFRKRSEKPACLGPLQSSKEARRAASRLPVLPLAERRGTTSAVDREHEQNEALHTGVVARLAVLTVTKPTVEDVPRALHARARRTRNGGVCGSTGRVRHGRGLAWTLTNVGRPLAGNGDIELAAGGVADGRAVAVTTVREKSWRRRGGRQEESTSGFGEGCEPTGSVEGAFESDEGIATARQRRERLGGRTPI